jgi:hypothetical protein
MHIDQKKKIVKLYALLQSVVYTIDDLNIGKTFFHKSKQLSSDLVKEITKTHKSNIEDMWQGGEKEETLHNILSSIDAISEEIAKMPLEALMIAPDFLKELSNGNVKVEE